MLPDRDTLAPPGRVLGPLLLAALFELVAVLFALPALEPGWYGRPGLLRATHAITLGALALSITGAGWQLVPVVVARPWRSRIAPLVNGALIAGLALMLLGFGAPRSALGHLGVGLAAGALLLRTLAVLRVIARAEGRLVPRLWLGLAEGFLWLGLAWGVALWAGRAGHPIIGDPISGVAKHATFLMVGWVGGWILGTGSLLLPMFAVGREPPTAWMAGALACWAAGLILGIAPLWALGALGGVAGLVGVLARGARRGPALLQAGAGLLGLAVAAALAASGRASGELVVSVGLLLGLLPMLRGVAQRIVPFLAWTHAYGGRLRGAPPVAALTPEPLSWAQGALGWTGGLVLVIGRALEQTGLARVGAVLLGIGALVHLFFLGRALALAALGHLRGQALAGTERR